MKLNKTLLATLLSTALLSGTAWAETVNINKADAKTIAQSLNGIGIKRAKAIVKYRNEFGKFKTIEELTKVKGIGKGILKKNKDDILLKDKHTSRKKSKS